MTEQHNHTFSSRRSFISRLIKAGLSAAAVCVTGYSFYDPRRPQGEKRITGTVQLADFSMADIPPRLSIIRGPNRQANLRRAVAAIGGIETYIKPGDRVVLKVNAAFASPPSLSATTHPETVAEIIRLCHKAGASQVTVTDNPINDPASCFTLSGIGRITEASGAALVLPKPNYFKPISVPGANLIRNWPLLFEPFKQADKLIGIAPLKDHHRSGASMIMKNWYGLLGGRRNIFHQDIHTIIKELSMMVRPTMVILDATTTMMTNGPTGGSLSDLMDTRTIIAGTDQVAVDAVGAEILGRALSELPFIEKAAAEGSGTSDYRSLKPVEETLPE